jgi:hypothetical protein
VTLPPVTLPEALPPPVPAGTTNDIGPGFDACAAPSAATMSAWLSHSPYRAVGIYIGGADRACAQPNLTAAWVSQQAAQGWHFIPIYVGPQAEYRQITAAVSQGLSAADDAITQAQVLGLGPGTPLYYDMEAYPRRQRIPALTLLSAWTVELHRLGYRSGVYSSADSAVTDLADHYTSFAVPDVIYFARWNRVASTSEQDIHSGEWTHHQRIHQYSGSTRRSYGGYRLNIDRDYLDVTLPIGTGAAGGAPAPWPSASPADNQPPATPLPDPTPPLRIPANPSRAARHLCTPPATCHA